jgi:uncharacterized membrane protein
MKSVLLMERPLSRTLVLCAAIALTSAACRGSEEEAAAEGPASAAADSSAAVTSDLTDLTGNWTVVAHRIPGVSTMGGAEAASWHGRTLRLEGTEALTSGGRCGDPNYEKRTADLDSLLAAGFKITPARLGFSEDHDRVRVLQVSCEGDPWTAMGAFLIEIDEEHAFAPWDGVFFELERDRAADAVDYRAKGNEPFWALEIASGEHIRFSRPGGGLRDVMTPVPEPKANPATGAVLYHAVTDDNELRVVIELTPCSDGMSGFAYETTATVTLNGGIYRGCGGPLP